MKSKFLLFIYVFLGAIAPKDLQAYSVKGHTIIGEIAFNCLDSVTRINVLKYLDGTSFSEAGLWMDEVRRDHSYDYMKTWHYINIERGESYQASGDENIINALGNVIIDFGKKESIPNEKIRTDLLILFHLIADLHQPLHVGYGVDRGGNEMQVNVNGHGTNLHKLWDDEIIQNQQISLDGCMLQYSLLSKEELANIKQINVVDWMTESRNLLDQVYDFNGHIIDENYMVRMKPVVEKELLIAGIRLAAILEMYFKNDNYIEDTQSVSDLVLNDQEAIDHIGEVATVCGQVYTAVYLESSPSKPTFINLGAAYPNQDFTIVIFNDYRLNFNYKPEEFLLDKSVCVTGTIKLYKEKAEIIVKQEDQLVSE